MYKITYSYYYIFIVTLLYGCTTPSNLKKEYTTLLEEYYYTYPKIQNTHDLNTFKSYLKEKYIHINHIKNDTYDIILDTTALNIRSQNFLSWPNTSIELQKEIIFPNWCISDIAITGYASKNYKAIRHTAILKRLEKQLMKKDSIFQIASLQNEPIHGKTLIYKYQHNKVSLYLNCDQYTNIQKINSLKQLLEEFMKREKKIDYALIPVLIIE